jgi:hypothetical protein
MTGINGAPSPIVQNATRRAAGKTADQQGSAGVHDEIRS